MRIPKLKLTDTQKAVVTVVARVAVPIAAIVVTDVVAKKLSKKND